LNEGLAGLAENCRGLVHPSVPGGEERARQARLIGVSLAAPFFYAAVAFQVYAGQAGTGTLLTGICALLGIGWLCALLVTASGRRAAVEPLALAVASFATGVLVSGGGGIGSPLAILAAALVGEAFWVGRTRRAAACGAVAAAAALFLAAMEMAPTGGAAPASALIWLVPLLYAASLWLRRDAFVGHRETEAPQIAEPPLEAIIDAAVLRLGKGGEVRLTSGEVRALLGIQPELLLGNGFFERIHVADRVAWLCAVADIRDGAARRKCDLRLRLPGRKGAGDHFRNFRLELASSGGDIIAVLRDGGDLAELQASLAEARESAEKLDVAKSRFLAAVSHELRTPLNAIIGFSDMLMHPMFGGFTDPRQKEYTKLIRDSGNHLLAVVNSILDVSKIESGVYPIKPEPFRFKDAADVCRAMMLPQAEAKSLAFEDRVEANAGEICGDRRAVQQMLINLISNAVKFTPEGGAISIGAKRIGPRLAFWVSDNGIGIAEDDLARLGEPFMQVQNDYTRGYEGTGLGLSLVKGLVTLHEGSMSIESAPGKGTTVTITLPVDGPSDKREGKHAPVALDPREASHVALRQTA
jgi:cell cycle sensor histidine kinase DivJ